MIQLRNIVLNCSKVGIQAGADCPGMSHGHGFFRKINYYDNHLRK